jgi:hypothetical protein
VLSARRSVQTPCRGAHQRISQRDGQHQLTYTLKTDNSGGYQLWLNQGFNPLQVIAAKDGYQPISKLARIIRGSSVTVNFSLNKS